MMKTEIRLATQADFEQVGNIFTEENQFHAELVPEIIQVADPIMTRKWYGEVLNNPHKTLFVAKRGKDAVGVALVELRTSIDDPIFTPRIYAHISEIAVAESHRGQGIGRLLIERIHQWAHDQSITEIELRVWERNSQAIGFYEKLEYLSWRRTMMFVIGDKSVERSESEDG